MNYELATKLKDAGFQLKECVEPGRCCIDFMFPTKNDKYYHYPSLEELIEACGDRFKEMYTYKNDDGISIWIAYSNNRHEFTGKGYTPHEAVARLWLELNK